MNNVPDQFAMKINNDRKFMTKIYLELFARFLTGGFYFATLKNAYSFDVYG